MSRNTLIIGAGPGLGMSIARRFGREGHRIQLVSRSAGRHPRFRAELAALGVEADTYAADVTDTPRFEAVLDEILDRHGEIDTVYYGASGADLNRPPVPITDMTAADATTAFEMVYPLVTAVSRLLPGIENRRGAVLIAGGLSAVRPLPVLGPLALSSAAIRNYAITLNTALADRGGYAGTLTIGGVVERGDIFHMVQAKPEVFGNLAERTLDPDRVADTAWDMVSRRDRVEEIFSVLD